MKIFQFEIEKIDSGIRIDKYLAVKTGISRRMLKKIILSGGCFLNGRRCHIQSYILKEGDRVKLFFEEEREFNTYLLDEGDILFEDEYFLVINKISGVPVSLSVTGMEDSIQRGVIRYFKNIGISHRPSVIHRLDKGTSGALIFGKNKEVEKRFYEMFRKREIEKEYIAVLCGEVREKRGRVKTKIARDPKFLNKYKVAYNRGKEAITRFKLLKVEKNLSFVKLIPKTGRPHQLRVHMSFYGNPVLGDTLYGGKNSNRLYLHAYKLRFNHPISGKMMVIKALPGDDWKYFKDYKID